MSSSASIQSSLRSRIQRARDTGAFETYLEVRRRVLDMLEEDRASSGQISKYWEEELSGFEYIFDASPLIIGDLRGHCWHITGIRAYEYRRHHSIRKGPFASKLASLKAVDHSNLFVPESPILGGFGHDLDGELVNLDTLKFYECLIGLDSQGFLDAFRNQGHGRSVVAEIGPGWGGFPYQFKTLFPNTTYVLIDLPSTLLLSMIYLKTAFPDASTFVYGDHPLSELPDRLRSFDFVFIPYYKLDQLELPGIKLMLNMVSFQEMTTEQVEGYVKRAYDWRSPHIYSLNRDRSKYNTQLSSVSAILTKHYETNEVDVLPVPYPQIGSQRPVSKEKSTLMKILRRTRKTVRFMKHQLDPRNERLINPAQTNDNYVHIAGHRRKASD